MSSFKVCLKDISYRLIVLAGLKKKTTLEAKVENVLKCLLRVNYFPFELTIKLILNRQTIGILSVLQWHKDLLGVF